MPLFEGSVYRFALLDIFGVARPGSRARREW
jgi:hypothetical protein